jgi:polysaccharide biosynthesis transport protein
MTDSFKPHDDPANAPARGATDTPSGHAMYQSVGAQIAHSPGREVHLLDYIRVLYKRRWIALSAFVIVFLGGAIHTFTATPLYEARTQILIEKESSNVVDFKEAFEQNQQTDDYYQTQYKILQSRALARRTLAVLNVWDAPAAGPPARLATDRVRAYITESVAWATGAQRAQAPVVAVAPDETERESRRVDRLLSGLTITPVRNSRLVDVKYTSADPVLATQIANELAKQYIEQNLEFKFLSSKEASDWLGERLAEQRKQVEGSEQALQLYREQTGAVALEDTQNIVVQKLVDLNAAVTRAKTDRIQREAAYRQIGAIETNRVGLDTFPAILANAYIQQLKTELSELQKQQAELSDKLLPRHPDMVKIGLAVQTAEAKLKNEIGKVVQSIRNEYEAALAQERSLVGALEQQKNDAMALNRKGIEYGVLARDAASNRQIFESLMQRTKETGISGELKTSNIRIVDPAEVPRGAASPNVRNNLLIALFAGLTLAMGLAFFFEYLDNRIKTPDEMKEHLTLPFLGMVPALFGKNSGNPLISSSVPPDFSESFRGVRTNLLFSFAQGGCRSVVITSTGPGEGKTIVAANIAIALAQAGERVLLVDADMRKPRLHDLFAMAQEPGLSNVLVGNAKSSAAVAKTAVSGLWVLPAGAHPPNPAELLGSKRFIDFMASLYEHFDWVILDTPPVMAVTDSSVVAHVASGVLFVVGAEMTSRYVAQRALDQLESAKARFVGAVLNRVDLKHHGYYYSHYYRREYRDYYNVGRTAS